MLDAMPMKLAQHRERIPAALDPVYTLDMLETEGRPGLKPEHVFDFEDGMRLIISKDRPEEHVCAAWRTSRGARCTEHIS